MAQFSKFEFLTDFSEPQAQEPAPLPEEEDEAPQPVFSEDELRNAREHGYESGSVQNLSHILLGNDGSVGFGLCRDQRLHVHVSSC